MEALIQKAKCYSSPAKFNKTLFTGIFPQTIKGLPKLFDDNLLGLNDDLSKHLFLRVTSLLSYKNCYFNSDIHMFLYSVLLPSTSINYICRHNAHSFAIERTRIENTVMEKGGTKPVHFSRM